MKKIKSPILFVLTAVVTLACANNEIEISDTNQNLVEDSTPQDVSEVEELTFELIMDLEKLETNNYNLLATMKLDEGAYYASPYSNNSFSGLFNIEIDQNENVTIGDTLIESPFPPEVDDQFSTEKVRWVNEDTNYEQLLTVNSQDNFEVTGVVSFVVEPVCNRYEVAFNILGQSGELSISQEEPVIANISN